MSLRRIAVAFLLICAFAFGSLAETITVPKGTKVDFATVAKEAKKPLPPTMTVADFTARLKEGGTFSLSGGDLVIGPADFSKDTTYFLALDTLELKNGARIVTNGNTLVVFANKVVSEDGAIVAFRQEDVKAADGAAGQPGKPGVPGRVVSFHVIQTITGILHVDLTGQDGGAGGPGQPGSPGAPGVKGDQAVWTVLPVPPFCNCNKAGGNGSPGSPGDRGARGGDGGNGGAGGIFELYNVGDAPIPAASYTFKSDAGKCGNGAPGGPGGAGGQGGIGGDGGGCCGGGVQGPTGANGPQGSPGNLGAVPNEGQAIVQNLNLEFMASHIMPGGPLEPKARLYFQVQ